VVLFSSNQDQDLGTFKAKVTTTSSNSDKCHSDLWSACKPWWVVSFSSGYKHIVLTKKNFETYTV